MSDNTNGNGHSNGSTSTVTSLAAVPAKSSVVSTKRECPLCASHNRQYIDTLVSELRDAANAPVIDTETGEITENTVSEDNKITYSKMESMVRELLTKIKDDTEFTLPDLIIHAGEHTLVSHLSGLAIKSEGNWLIAGDQIYQKIDPKDALSYAIAVGTEMLSKGKMKLTANAWTNMMALLWRMQGNAGSDEFIMAMIEKTQAASVSPESPLGASYLDRQRKMEQKQARLQKEAEELLAQESDDAPAG